MTAAAPSVAPASATHEQVRAATIASLRALMLIRSYRVRGHLEGAARSARPADPGAARGTGPAHLRLHQRRPGSTDLHRQRAGARDRDPARDHPHPARHLLRLHRRRVHAHPGSRAEILDPAQGRGRPLAGRVRRQRQAPHPGTTDRGRGLRGVLPEALRHDEALRAGGRRGRHPRHARDHRERRARGRPGSRHRDAASRPPQHPRQHRQEAADPRLLGIRRRELQARRRAGLRRREVPPGHLDGPGDRGGDGASVAATQPLAPGGGRSRRRRQGPRAPGPRGRHPAPVLGDGDPDARRRGPSRARASSTRPWR